MLQELLPRQCYIKNKTLGGVVEIKRTLDHPKPNEVANIADEDEFMREVTACGIGSKYLRDRKELNAEYRARRSALTSSGEPKIFKERKEKNK